LLDKRHLDVDLSELRLSIGSQVFIAEAASDLHVTVVTGHHQQLLVKLWRLRQRIKLSRMHAARDEIIPSPFRSALAEHRRFDVEKPVLVEVISNRLRQLVSQNHRLLKLWPTQVDVAVLQPQLFIRQR